MDIQDGIVKLDADLYALQTEDVFLEVVSATVVFSLTATADVPETNDISNTAMFGII